MRIDIEPVYWGTSWNYSLLKTAAWAAGATLLIFLAHFIAAVLHSAKEADKRSRRLSIRTSIWFAKEFIHWYFRALVLSLLCIPATLVVGLTVLFSSSVRNKCLDALAWTADPGKRQEIIQRVEPRLRLNEPGVQQVLVGHSQGGSILTTTSMSGAHRGQKTTLITLGSGQGLLTVLNAFPKAGIISALIFQCSLSLLMLFSLTQLLPLLQVLVQLLMFTWETLVSLGQIVWLVPLSLETAHSISAILLYDEVRMLSLMLQTALAFNPAGAFTLFAPLTVTMVALIAANRKGIQTTAETVGASCRPDSPGVDISAKHDYVSSILSVFSGTSPRFQRIPQVGSFPADHLNYFTNGPLALEPIVRAIESHASRGKAPTGSFEIPQELKRLHGTDLHLAKAKAWMCWLFLASAVVPALQSLPAEGALALAAIAFAVIGIGAWYGLTIAMRRRLGKLTGHTLEGRYGLYAEAHERAIVASKPLAVACLAAALPAWGIFAFGLHSPVPGLPSLGATAISGTVGVTLVPAALLVWGGLRRGLWWAIVGFTLGAFMWSLQFTLYGFIVVAIHLLLVGWCKVKLRRLGKPINLAGEEPPFECESQAPAHG